MMMHFSLSLFLSWVTQFVFFIARSYSALGKITINVRRILENHIARHLAKGRDAPLLFISEVGMAEVSPTLSTDTCVFQEPSYKCCQSQVLYFT